MKISSQKRRIGKGILSVRPTMILLVLTIVPTATTSANYSRVKILLIRRPIPQHYVSLRAMMKFNQKNVVAIKEPIRTLHLAATLTRGTKKS